MHLITRDDIQPFVGDDKAIIRELASPENSGLTRHSFAEIRHPPGTASLEHYHREAEEVYYGIGEPCSPAIDRAGTTLSSSSTVSVACTLHPEQQR